MSRSVWAEYERMRTAYGCATSEYLAAVAAFPRYDTSGPEAKMDEARAALDDFVWRLMHDRERLASAARSTLRAAIDAARGATGQEETDGNV